VKAIRNYTVTIRRVSEYTQTVQAVDEDEAREIAERDHETWGADDVWTEIVKAKEAA
jgi:hypothetical protein